jgi:transcriptional regulator with XRE-family HTH domain
VTALKRETAAGLVRDMIADGTLNPGAPAPSGAALARKTGFSTLTCRHALGTLLADGTLTRGVSPTARLLVAQRGGAGAGNADALRVTLSRSRAGRRHAAGMTQPELAGKLEVSVTTVGHAETGRTWQGRSFWLRADRELGADGDLLRLYGRYKAAECEARDEADSVAPEEAAPVALAGPAVPVLPASVTITPVGVLVVWQDGTETLAAPPASQDRAEVRQSGG